MAIDAQTLLSALVGIVAVGLVVRSGVLRYRSRQIIERRLKEWIDIGR